MKLKRGLSGVVTTLILVLLVLAAVGVVWVVISGIIEEGTDSAAIGSKCLKIDIKATKVNCNSSSCNVTFTRSDGGDDIAGIKLILGKEEGETNIILDVPGNIAPLSTKTESIVSSEIEDLDPDKVEIIAYLNDSSGNEKTCPQKSFSFEFVPPSESTGSGGGGSTDCNVNEDCFPGCSGNKILSYSCSSGNCVYSSEPSCSMESCDAFCESDIHCPVPQGGGSYCDTDSCECVFTQEPPIIPQPQCFEDADCPITCSDGKYSPAVCSGLACLYTDTQVCSKDNCDAQCETDKDCVAPEGGFAVCDLPTCSCIIAIP